MSSAATDVVIGVVGRPWGTRGQFTLDPRGSEPEFVLARSPLRLRRRDGTILEMPILGSHRAGGRLVVAVEGCATPEAAERLRGAEVLRSAADFEPAPEGSYYPHQLASMKVVRDTGEVIGSVVRLVATSGPDLLEVAAGGKTLLIPFVAEICRVDPAAGAIVVAPPEGLLELS